MKVKLILFTAVVFLLSACGSKTTYSHEACQKFSEKIQNSKELSSSEIDEGIDLFEGLVNELQEVSQQPEAAQKEYAEKHPEVVSDALGLAFVLAACENSMSDSQKERCQKLGEKMKKIEK